ncbi:MAG: nucleotidyltransferase domain-containing protein [bacterium]
MINDKDIKTAKALMDVISSFTEILSFKVFGSRARGDWDRDSDMDIFIVVPRLTPELDKKISDAAWEVGMENDVVIATIVCTPEDLNKPGFRGSPFLNVLEKEGIAV